MNGELQLMKEQCALALGLFFFAAHSRHTDRWSGYLAEVQIPK